MYTRISTAVLVGLLLVALVGVFEPAAAQTEENKAIVQRWLEHPCNPDALRELGAADYVYHGLDGDQDLESTLQTLAEQCATLAGLQYGADDLIAEGDKVAQRCTVTGTHQPTGIYITVPVMRITRIADGKIAEEWAIADEVGVLQQLGVIPPMPDLADVLPPVMNRKPEDCLWTTPSNVMGDPGTPEANKALILRQYEELNQGNMDVIDEIFDPRFVFHDPSWPIITDFESFKPWVGSIRAMFPDHEWILEDVIAEEDKVASRWMTRWTDPQTGQLNSMVGINIERFADGKVVEGWSSKDFLRYMQQLGVIPPLTAVERSTWGQVKSLFQD